VTLEVSREMRLIVKAHARRHERDGFPVQQAPPRGVDATPDHVAMWRDAERASEAPNEMRRRHMQDLTSLPQRHAIEASRIEQVPQRGRDLVVGSLGVGVGPLAEVPREPRAHDGEDRFRLERRIRISQRAMQCVERAGERRVLDVGVVDRAAGEAFVEDLTSNVKHPFAEPGAGGGAPVVHDVRRKDRDPSTGGAPMVCFEVVADRAFVHDEDRPRVMRVRRIHVLDEACMEDLVDTGNLRLPCSNPLLLRLRGRGHDATIVQDVVPSPALDGVDAERIPSPAVNELVALVGFAFVGSVTPGPNNAVLWASGLRFGFRRTVPHVVGTALGIAALVIGVAAGIGVLIDAIPAADIALKLVGSAYLLYVAFLVLRGGAVGLADVTHPLNIWQAIVFQCVNPKAWIFAIAAVGTFLPPALPRPVGTALVAGTLMVVVVGSSCVWAAGGAALGRVVDDERMRRAVSAVLVVMLMASVAFIWV